jgi:hypothetical protein
MMTVEFATIGVALWTVGVPLGAGAVVASLVLGSAGIYRRWRERLNFASREEDLPWDSLLILLEQRNRDRAAAGLPPQQPTEAELDQMLAKLPAVKVTQPVELPEDREFKVKGATEQRTGRRRWGNPTEVRLITELSEEPIHGIVLNRSTGGLGIYVDTEIPPDTLVTIRAVEAPSHVRSVFAEVRHCRKVANGFAVGCQFRTEIPWGVRVWFG